MALRGRLNQVQRTLILHCGVEGGLSLWPSYHQRPLKRLIDAKNDTYNFAVLPRRAGLGNASNSVTVWGIDKIPPHGCRNFACWENISGADNAP